MSDVAASSLLSLYIYVLQFHQKRKIENLLIILIMGSRMSLNLDIGGIYKKIIDSKLLLMMEF